MGGGGGGGTIYCVCSLTVCNVGTAQLIYSNIRKIRRNLTKPAAETLVNACVTSVMDYANSTSLGVPQWHTNSLQRLQNMAARIICRCGPRDHVTPLRKELHWLPIEARNTKYCVTHTKPYRAIYRSICVTWSVFTTPSDVASDRATLVSRDYVLLKQILLNMDICVIVLLHLLYGTSYQKTFGQLRHLLLLKSH